MDRHNQAMHPLDWPSDLTTTAPTEVPGPDGLFPTVNGQAWAEPLSMAASGGLSFHFEPAAMPPPHKDPPPQVPFDEPPYPPAVPSGGTSGVDDGRARADRVSRQETGSRRNQRKPRMKPPSESAWKAQKEVIRTLYMERKLSLAETMEHMETIFNFKAS